MKELLQGRRFGFAPRPALGFVALGLGIAVTLSDLMAWFGWGARDSSGFVVVSYWLAAATAVIAAIALLAAVAEYVDVPEEERELARLDLAGAFAVFLLYAASAALRSADTAGAAAPPAPFLVAVAALLVQLVDVVVAANLYAAREWEQLEEEPSRERHPRRRAALR